MSNPQTTKKILLVLLCTFVTACHTQGDYLKEDDVEDMQTSITTAEELEAELGSPSTTVPMIDGKVMWVYEGVHTMRDPTNFVPYLGILVGTNSQKCTRLTVLVDRDNGELSDWKYVSDTDTDHWSNTDNKCGARGKR